MIKVSQGWECGGRLIQTTIFCLFVSYSLDLCPHFQMSLQTDLEISRWHKIPQGRGIFRFWVIKTPLDIFLGGFAKVLCTRELMSLLHCRQQSYPSFQNSTFVSNRLTPPCGIAAVRNQEAEAFPILLCQMCRLYLGSFGVFLFSRTGVMNGESPDGSWQ